MTDEWVVRRLEKLQGKLYKAIADIESIKLLLSGRSNDFVCIEGELIPFDNLSPEDLKVFSDGGES